MNITVFNPVDGTTITIAEGAEGVVTIPQNVGAGGGNRVLGVTGDTVIGLDADGIAAARTVGWTHFGDLVASLTMDVQWDVGASLYAQVATVSYTLANGQPVGTYWQTLIMRTLIPAVEPHFFTFGLKIQVVPAVMFVARRSALPDADIDLEFDIALGTVRSANLGLRGALSVGATPTFAVVPSLAGSVLLTLVTEVSLCIRRKNEFGEPKLFEIAADGTITGSGAAQHYALNADLKSGGITEAFGELDDEPVDVNNPDRVQVLPVLAQLRVKYDGNNYVSAPFALSLYQPVDETLLS